MAGGDALDRALQASDLVAVGEDGGADRPLRLVGTSLYLDRYWREEREVAADLQALGEAAADGVRDEVLAEGLARLFGGDDADERQRLAAAAAVRHRFAVVAGGPGTGKTTTVARIVALLAEQAAAAGAPEPLVALAAPTAVAAARLEEAVHDAAARLDVDAGVRAQLLAMSASTLHRLLGWRPDSQSRFRHHRGNRLPHDIVIVDETSMVSLSQMARLLEAVRPQARLVLVGDPGQLTSIEAGAVLGDVVGPADDDDAPATGIGAGIVVLEACIATAARSRRWPRRSAAATPTRRSRRWPRLRRGDLAAGRRRRAARPRPRPRRRRRRRPCRDRGGPRAATRAARCAALGQLPRAVRAPPRAVRRGDVDGPDRALARERGRGLRRRGQWYVGRPLLVTENDYGLRLYNGDTGVVVATASGRVERRLRAPRRRDRASARRAWPRSTASTR